MRLTLLTLVALGALHGFGALPHAQDEPVLRRVTKPLQNASLELQTGTVTRGAAVASKGLPGFNTCSSVSNLDHSGFVGVDSGPGTAIGPCEWIQAATKSTGKSEFMTAFAFAYCSAAQDVLSGGPGGKARVGFRNGYRGPRTGAVPSPSGTDAALFNLSGLPAWTGCSSFFGGFNCFLIGIDLGTVPVVLIDGPIAWSWQFRDLGTDGVLAKTFPFLGCVASCTPFAGALGKFPDGLGMDDTVDQYCPAGLALSTFSFGTSTFGGHFTSVSMDVVEAEAIAASTTVVTGGNPNILAAGAGPAIGRPWSVDLDCVGAGSGKLSVFRSSFFPIAPTPSRWGNVLCALTPGTGRSFIVPQNDVAPTTLGPYLLPLDLTLYGLCYCVQALCGSSPVGYLSNALLQTVGN